MKENNKDETKQVQKLLIEVSVDDAKLLRMIAARKNLTRYRYIGQQLAYICENERKRLSIKQLKLPAKKSV